MLQVQAPPSGVYSQAEPPAFLAQAEGQQSARAKVALLHGRLVPFLFFAARGEAQGGLRHADARPASPQAAKWVER